MQNPKKTRIQFELGSVSRILMYSLLLSDYSSLFLTFSTYSDTDYIAFHLLPFLGMFEINHTQNASDITFFWVNYADFGENEKYEKNRPYASDYIVCRTK